MIKIKNSKSKTKPFKVRYDGINGECLAPSQNLTTKENCFVNIRCRLGGFAIKKQGTCNKHLKKGI